MSKAPIAVLISDVHYSVHTLNLADKVMRQAIEKANSLNVPLVVAGDLHDTKANLRGECITAIIATIKQATIRPFLIVGNHDRINERAPEHSLEFLRPYANIVDKPTKNCIPLCTISPKCNSSWTLLPYFHDSKELTMYINTIPGANIIMHQGVQNSNSGHYIQDKSAINKFDLAGHRVISGHYHTRQTFDLPDGGKFDYIGNPYTTGFGEANDPEKGYQILFDDTSLEFVPTNLRQHCVMELTLDKLEGETMFLGEDHDLVWVKLKGPSDKLATVTKAYVADMLDIKQGFRLDLIPDDTKATEPTESQPDVPQDAVLDGMIDNLQVDEGRKVRLKDLWKGLL